VFVYLRAQIYAARELATSVANACHRAHECWRVPVILFTEIPNARPQPSSVSLRDRLSLEFHQTRRPADEVAGTLRKPAPRELWRLRVAVPICGLCLG
jgi:hypothetical protein